MNIRSAVVALTEALPILIRMLPILIFTICSMTNMGRQMTTMSRNFAGDVSVLPLYVGWYDLAKHCLLHVLFSHNGHRVPTINFIALCCYLQGYWDGYDPNVNPNVIDAFAAAAFRFGHSLLPTAIERWSKAHKFIGKRNVTWAVPKLSWKLLQF
jgi:hypothetical protein